MSTIIRRFAASCLLVTYAVLLSVSSISYFAARAFNDPDGGNGDGYNPIIEVGGYHTPAELPVLFPAAAHLALSLQAATDGQIEAARQHAFNALRSNPAHGEATLMLMDLYARPNMYKLYAPLEDTEEDAQGNYNTKDNTDAASLTANDDFINLSPIDRAITDELANISFTLRPTYVANLSALAEYWLAQGKHEKAIQIWSNLLTIYPDAANEAFPVFHKALNDPQLAKNFQHYIEVPQKWWTSFFHYLLEHESDPIKLQHYYQIRSQSIYPIETEERGSYINYLVKNEQWIQAYQTWQKGIEKSATDQLLYDGGFEYAEKNNEYFTWQTQETQGIKIKRESTAGITGKKALHITFRKSNSILFQHISQNRELTANKYTLQGRYRVDQLKTSKGLRWRVHCLDDQASVLAESEVFKGNSGWKTFQMDFTISDACKVQIIRLESDSQYAYNNVFEGSIWFDDLSITATQ